MKFQSNNRSRAAAAARARRRAARLILCLMGFMLAVLPATQAAAQKNAAPVRKTAQATFQQYCSVCHGEKGDGKSMARRALNPAPRDFTDPKAREELSRIHMVETVLKGKRTKDNLPTAMVAWKSQLSRKEAEGVVDYIIVSFMGGKVADEKAAAEHAHHGHDHGAHAAQQASQYPYSLTGNAQRGKRVYSSQCAACHGDKGAGDGERVRALHTRPRDFRDPAYGAKLERWPLYSAVAVGKASSGMPAWANVISDQDIADVSEYVMQTLLRTR